MSTPDESPAGEEQLSMKDPSRKLKIAIVMDRFIPSRGGESYFSWLAQELSDRGHEVHVFAWSAKELGNIPTGGYTWTLSKASNEK